jgi:glutathione S-transferase
MANPEYQLYCFGESGNAYRVALMLNLIGAAWKPIWVDFFKGGESRSAKFRTEINEMGEVPVLVHGTRKLAQSAVCLIYLAERSGQYQPADEDEKLECLRWIIFDNQKVSGYLGPYRFLRNFAPSRDPGAEAFLKGRLDNSLGIIDKRLAQGPYLLGGRPTLADLSLAAYLFYPPDEYGFDIAGAYPAIGAWTERIKALPGWRHPYELMPRQPTER